MHREPGHPGLFRTGREPLPGGGGPALELEVRAAGARGRELEGGGPVLELELEVRAAGIKKPPALGRGSLAVLRGLKAKVCLDLDRGVR